MAKEAITLNINEKFKIVKSGENFSLIEKIPGKDSKGKAKDQESTTYHGCLYQALQAFLRKSVDNSGSIEEIYIKISVAVKEIKFSEDMIKATFSTEIKRIT